MNLPNKLTLFRIMIIPVIVVVAYIKPWNENTIFLNVSLANFINCMLFILASLTDFLDGYLARKNNQVTTFGKFADPLADKMLVFAAMLILAGQNVVPIWIVIVIMAREFIVSGIRLVAVERGNVIAASNLGKYKTASTMLALVVLFFFQSHETVELVGRIILYVATALTIVSGIDYFWKNRKTILESI